MFLDGKEHKKSSRQFMDSENFIDANLSATGSKDKIWNGWRVQLTISSEAQGCHTYDLCRKGQDQGIGQGQGQG